MIRRRGLLAGLGALLAAPAIIRTPGLLMPVKPVPIGWDFGRDLGTFLGPFPVHTHGLYPHQARFLETLAREEIAIRTRVPRLPPPAVWATADGGEAGTFSQEAWDRLKRDLNGDWGGKA